MQFWRKIRNPQLKGWGLVIIGVKWIYTNWYCLNIRCEIMWSAVGRHTSVAHGPPAASAPGREMRLRSSVSIRQTSVRNFFLRFFFRPRKREEESGQHRFPLSSYFNCALYVPSTYDLGSIFGESDSALETRGNGLIAPALMYYLPCVAEFWDLNSPCQKYILCDMYNILRMYYYFYFEVPETFDSLTSQKLVVLHFQLVQVIASKVR